MKHSQHPSLDRIYGGNNDDEFLYIDETLLAPEEGAADNFYIITAAKYSKSELQVLRDDLIKFADENLFPGKRPPYWHSTEALQTSAGRDAFESMLSYLCDNSDQSFVTCKVGIEQDSNESSSKKSVGEVENARRDCLRELFSVVLPENPKVSGAVFERRQSNKDNDRDKNILRALTKDGVIPASFHRAWVSPREEVVLWVPDTVGLAYRRTRTHTDETSQYFSKYLKGITDVHEF